MTEIRAEDTTPEPVPVIVTTCVPAGGNFTGLPLLQLVAPAASASTIASKTELRAARFRLANPITPIGSTIASHVRFFGASGRFPKALTLGDTVIMAVACPAIPPLTVTVVGATAHVT